MLNLFRMLEERLHWGFHLVFWVLIMFCLFAVIFVKGCSAEPSYTNEQIVDAIYFSEGGMRSSYPYGILSIKHCENDCKNSCSLEIRTKWARHIALNTVKNQRKRHFKHTSCGKSYLECLAARYCPIGAKNDPQGLNKNWLKNVLFFLRRRLNDTETSRK